MELSDVKLVVADMDGTLLNSDHQVSTHFFDLYQRLKEKGIQFTAASGRQYGSIVDKLGGIGKEITVIAENGGYMVRRGQEVLSTPLERKQLDLILDKVTTIDSAHTVLCGKHSAFLRPNSREFLDELSEYYVNYEILDNLMDFEGDVMKVAVYHDLGSEKHIYPHVKHLEGELKVKVSGEFWVDLSHLNTHKGYALQKLQQELAISPAETMVFGDYNNDLEMLSLAYYSYAMANAHPNVLEAARFVTASNDEFGVESVLEKLLESKS